MSKYVELLQHPNWQKKRLEILSRADFECENCGDKEKTLHVHHAYYEKGKAPWEYPDHALSCLCDSCHAEAEVARLSLLHSLSLMVCGSCAFDRVRGYVEAMVAITWERKEVPVSSFEHAEGIGDAFHLGPEAVIAHVKDGMVALRILQALGKDPYSPK